jgi:hypothetical protein
VAAQAVFAATMSTLSSEPNSLAVIERAATSSLCSSLRSSSEPRARSFPRTGPRIDHSHASFDKLADVPRDNGQAMVRGGCGDEHIGM